MLTRLPALLLSMVFGATSFAQQPSPPSTTSGPRAPAPTQAELVKRLTFSVDSLAKLGQFSGVVVLSKNEVPVYQSAHGLADRERGVANNLETTFNLGSINKIFTQIAIRQLFDA